MRAPAPLELAPGPPLAPGPTLALLPRLVHPRAGIFAALERIAFEEMPSVEIWSAVGSLAIRGGPRVRRSLGASAALDPDVAKVRALGEAMQAYALGGPDPRGETAPWKLAAPHAADPDEFQPHAARDIATDAPLRWSWATRPTTRAVALLPESAFAESAPLGQSLPTAVGNGSACANTPTEAAARALAEGIERDALMIFWLRRGPVVGLPPDEVRDDAFQSLRGLAEEAGLRVVLRDITSGIGLPVVACLLTADDASPPFCAMGTGANEDMHLAARRALEEAIQMRLRYRSLHESGASGSGAFRWWSAATARPDAWFLADGETGALRSSRPLAAPERALHLARKVEAAGGRAYVADLTTDDLRSLGLSVCAAALPGLLPKTTVPALSRTARRRLDTLGVPARGPFVPLPFP